MLALLLVASISSAGNLPLEIKGRVEDEYGKQGVARLQSWEKLVWDMAYQSRKAQLHAVNEFFNRMDFKSDQEHWQQYDYWATPIETLASNGGDCEDFAIAAADANNHILTWNSDHYPALLREIKGAPPLLFVSGDVSVLSFPQIDPLKKAQGAVFFKSTEHHHIVFLPRIAGHSPFRRFGKVAGQHKPA